MHHPPHAARLSAIQYSVAIATWLLRPAAVTNSRVAAAITRNGRVGLVHHFSWWCCLRAPPAPNQCRTLSCCQMQLNSVARCNSLPQPPLLNLAELRPTAARDQTLHHVVVGLFPSLTICCHCFPDMDSASVLAHNAHINPVASHIQPTVCGPAVLSGYTVLARPCHTSASLSLNAHHALNCMYPDMSSRHN